MRKVIHFYTFLWSLIAKIAMKAKKELLQHLKLPFNSQCFSFQEENKKVIIKEHYNIGQSREIIREVGNWNRSGLFLSDVPLLVRRQNLQGIHKIIDRNYHASIWGILQFWKYMIISFFTHTWQILPLNSIFQISNLRVKLSIFWFVT